MTEVKKPRNKLDSDAPVQMNFRLTNWLNWKIYRFAKQQKCGQSIAVCRILEAFFAADDSEGDWRAKKQ